MSKYQHTPGPYEVIDETDIDNALWIYAPDRENGERSIATVRDGQRGGFNTSPQSAETWANARLFAASPALLAACEAMLADYEAIVESDYGGTSHYAPMMQRAAAARAAIKAATGENE